MTLEKEFLKINVFCKVLFLTLFTYSLLVTSLSQYYFNKIDLLEELSLKKTDYLASLYNSKSKNKYLISKYNQIIDINNVLSYLTNNNVPYSTMDISYTIVEESTKENIDPYLILSLILTESSFNHKSISRKGAIGLMQILPNTAYYISNLNDDIEISHKKELFDPITNIKIGINYFAYLIKKYNGNVKYAIIAYNLGPSNLNYRLRKKKRIPKFYYNRVIRNYQLISTIKNNA
ncbi:lytic transglycosylase domain-containing protein [Deferribacter thermophilus]|uniref:lytic transglycosylase domain-containing protein n=1 Tax=Deferribacter thermophilus TaxID=53573 RepID=UPI003C1EBA5F